VDTECRPAWTVSLLDTGVWQKTSLKHASDAADCVGQNVGAKEPVHEYCHEQEVLTISGSRMKRLSLLDRTLHGIGTACVSILHGVRGGVRFPTGAGISLFIAVFRLALRPTKPPPVGTSSFPGVKAAGREANH
jgi:hypothetical protein